MVRGVDVGDGSSAWHVGHPVGEQLVPGHQHPGRRRAADELVRRQEDRVLVRQRPVGGSRHLDPDVRRGRGEVPEGQGAVAVEQLGDPERVRDDAGDVGGRREGTDLQRPLGVLLQLLGELLLVDETVGVLMDGDDVGDGLAPGDLVGVVLVGAEEDHRTLGRRDVGRQVVLVVEDRRDPQAEDPDQLGDRAGAARAGEEHDRVAVAAHGLADDLAGLLAQPAGLQPGAAGLGVGVGVARQHLVADEVFEKRECPAGGGVVGVGDPALTVRRGHHVVLADDGLAHERDQRRGRCGHVSRVEPKGANHPPEVRRPSSNGRRPRRRRSSDAARPSVVVVRRSLSSP